MKTKLTLFAIFISLSVFSQAPNWAWAKSAGGNSFDGANSIYADGTGNIYVAGNFISSSIVFGSTTLTNTWNGQMFLVKYDVNGNVIWAQSASGSNANGAQSVSGDPSGNIVVAGFFSSSTISFGSTTLTNPFPNNADMFVVKYDSNGNPQWATNSGGDPYTYPSSVCADASGNVFVTGNYSGAYIIFDSDTLFNSYAGSNDIFIEKYSTNGIPSWSLTAGGGSDDNSSAIFTDDSGYVYLTGSFTSSITFGSITLNTTGNHDIFLVKFDGAGNVIWARSAGGQNYDNDVSTCGQADQKGNVFIAGYFSSDTLILGLDTLINSSMNINDMFIAKYSATGNLVWARSAGGIMTEMAYALTTDSVGNAFAGGVFSSSNLIFGFDTLVYSGGVSDIFLAKYDTVGNVIWAKSVGGSMADFVTGAAKDQSENIYLAGWYDSPTLAFGSTTLTNIDNTGSSHDMFISKIDNLGVGINQINFSKENLNYAPNPSSGIFTIKAENNFSGTISITNILGEIIYQTQIQNSNSEIDLSSEPDGIYFVNVKNEKESFTQKIIIQK
ncbi:MAG: T9SS type A sorting domain-containing protein [Bacteroidetes bacterium]|nr:T9SS type A sorting domain-containing protein [Bacteroidota bacterium]